jgi:hypothetical protein
MTSLLSQRKYRLAARLSIETLRTWGLWTSITFFACGTTAGAAMLRFRSRWIGAAVSGLAVGIVLYRQSLLSLALNMGDAGANGVLVDTPIGALLAPFDAVLAAVYVFLIWALVSWAPIPPKRA